MQQKYRESWENSHLINFAQNNVTLSKVKVDASVECSSNLEIIECIFKIQCWMEAYTYEIWILLYLC